MGLGCVCPKPPPPILPIACPWCGSVMAVMLTSLLVNVLGIRSQIRECRGLRWRSGPVQIVHIEGWAHSTSSDLSSPLTLRHKSPVDDNRNTFTASLPALYYVFVLTVSDAWVFCCNNDYFCLRALSIRHPPGKCQQLVFWLSAGSCVPHPGGHFYAGVLLCLHLRRHRWGFTWSPRRCGPHGNWAAPKRDSNSSFISLSLGELPWLLSDSSAVGVVCDMCNDDKDCIITDGVVETIFSISHQWIRDDTCPQRACNNNNTT